MTLIARPLAVVSMLLAALFVAVALAAPAQARPIEPCIPGATPPIGDGAPDFSCH